MDLTQWIVSLVLLTWALARNLGTRRVTRTTFVLPAVLVVVIGGWLLRPIPTQGNDLDLIGLCALVGLLLGVAAGAVTRLDRRDGGLVATAGASFAAIWVLLIAGRVAFAEWATGPGGQTIGRFSMEHAITGADAWTAAFVTMALATVVARTGYLAVASARASRRREATRWLSAGTSV